MPKSARRRTTRASTSASPVSDRIRIDFVILADFAQAVQGKLSVIGGGWNLHNATQYPSTLHFGLGIGILVPWPETNRKHKFNFVIRASEGAELASGGGDFEVGRQPGLPPGMTQRVVIGLSGQLQIPQPGSYEVAVTAADVERVVTFEALPVPVPSLR